MTTIKHLPKIDGEIGWYELCEGKDKPLGRKLQEDLKFDFCIVGAGIAGVSVALSLANLYRDSKIALVEALKIGQGTSSRNAGFIIDLPHNLDGSEANVEHDKKIYELNCFAIDFLKDLVDKHNINCHWQKAGKYMCAHEDTNIQGLRAFEEHLQPSGFAFERVKGKELEQRLGTSYYQEAVYTPDNILMNPSALMRGLVTHLPDNVAVFEESPVLTFEKKEDIKIIKSRAGSIQSKILILALDSHLEEFKIVRYKQAPIFTYASLSEPLSENEINQYFPNVQAYGLTSAHPAGTTVRFTPDKRIFVRNLLDFFPDLQCKSEDLQRAYKRHRLSFEARFPYLSHKKFQFTWGGFLCMTLNHQSVFGNFGDGIYCIGGSNGVGMAKGVYLGYYLAELIAGNHSPNLDFILENNKASFMPPEPLRSIGAKIRLWYEQRNALGDI
ncbi:FAD-binding oxidoreductase [Helicobacter aurati]|uniref:FAD-binding oxidoreductase n=1 Tax=Helicobacter aurati TaxID=137778 RepID=A0A3D8J0M4_9HELI|nr:FAD-binding oxidoreductase [Helicobacter aurati]RDU71067.1 FAD-binding oxidoreductase [Helicobacter aurati]